MPSADDSLTGLIAAALVASPCGRKLGPGISTRKHRLHLPEEHPNQLQRLAQSLVASRWGAWFFSRTLHHIDFLSLKLTRGRRTFAGVVGGVPVLILTTTGAQSGLPRSVPLAVHPNGREIVLIASNFGQRHHPAWYHNLKAEPEASLTLDNVSQRYLAREADDNERQRYWQLATARYPGYDAYQLRTGGRKIPVMVLTPVNAEPIDNVP